jgi:hypothetical protein
MPLNGIGSGSATRSRIRPTVSALKSARARKIRLPTEIRALFSLKGSVAFLRMNSMRQASIFSGVSVRSLMASRFSLCLSGNVSGDLAQRLRVTLKRLWRKETPRGHGFDVFADRHIDLLGCWVSTALAHDDFPAIGAHVVVQFESQRGGVLTIIVIQAYL